VTSRGRCAICRCGHGSKEVGVIMSQMVWVWNQNVSQSFHRILCFWMILYRPVLWVHVPASVSVEPRQAGDRISVQPPYPRDSPSELALRLDWAQPIEHTHCVSDRTASRSTVPLLCTGMPGPRCSCSVQKTDYILERGSSTPNSLSIDLNDVDSTSLSVIVPYRQR